MNITKKSPGSIEDVDGKKTYTWEKAGDIVDVVDEFAHKILEIGSGEYEHVVSEVKAAAKKVAAKKSAPEKPDTEVKAATTADVTADVK